MKKKLLTFFLYTALLSSSFASALSPARTAQCAWTPKKYNCSDEEKKKARKWFIAVPVAIAVAALAAIGIRATSDAVKEAKKEQAALETKEFYLREEYTKLGLKKANLQRQIQDNMQKGEDISLLQIQLTPTEERMAEITKELEALRRK